MTSFLKSPDPVLTQDGLLKTSSQYILEQYRIDSDQIPLENKLLTGNGVDTVQKIIDSTNQKLRMYGTGEELAENLRIFKNFPGSHAFFESDIDEPYSTTPIPYRCVNGEKFFCKSDLFLILQNVILKLAFGPKPRVACSMIALLLKSREEKLNGQLEFVRFDQKEFDEIEKDLRIGMRGFISTNEQIRNIKLDFSILTFDDIYSLFMDLLPNEFVEKHDLGDNELERRMRQLYRGLRDDGPPAMVLLYLNSRIISDCLKKVIEKRPKMFLPYSAKELITVRMFEDGEKKFVIKQELFRAINLDSEEKIEEVVEDMYIDTMEMNLVLKEFEERINRIQFIRTPILRAKHRAVPIPGVNPGEFYILASDALFHLLRSVIIGGKIFQRPPSQTVIFIMEKIESTFETIKTVQFIELKSFNRLEKLINDKMSGLPPAKDIRNAKPDGFTIENLKNELKNLGVTEVMIEVLDYAEEVYEEVKRLKKREHLRTCDLFDAVEMCQVVAVLNRHDYLKNFLHYQNACGKVIGMKCNLCQPPQADASSPEATNDRLKEFNSTKWKAYSQEDIGLISGYGEFGIIPAMKLKDGTNLFSSFNVYRKMIHLTNEENRKTKFTDKDFEELTKTAKLFFMDERDLDEVLKNLNTLNSQINLLKYADEKDDKPFLHDILSYSMFRKKQFYIRTMSSSAIQKEKHCRVFEEHFFEVLTAILYQKSYPEEKFQKFQKKQKNEIGRMTIGMKEMAEVLEEFDIDKSRITLVPEFYHVLTTKRARTSCGAPVIEARYEQEENVLDSTQAIFLIFQSIICDIDWTKNPCKKHKNCKTQYKSIIIGELKKFKSMRDGVYISTENVENRVKTLKTFCNYSSRKNLTPPPLVKIFDCDFKDSISLLFFLSESKKFGLRYRAPKGSTEKELEEAILPIWKARLLFMMEWIQMFFGNEEEELKAIIRRAVMIRAPFENFENEEELMDLILCTTPNKQKFVEQLLKSDTRSSPKFQYHELLSNVRDRKYVIRGKSNRWNSSVKLLRQIVQESEDVGKLEEATTSESSASTSEGKRKPLKSPDDIDLSVQAPKTATDVVKAPEPIKATVSSKDTKTSNKKPSQDAKFSTTVAPQLKNCEKCHRTGETLNETKENLKENENKVKKLEKQLGETAKELVEMKKIDMEEKKKEMEEKEKEIEELKRELTEKSHVSSENDALKLKIQQLESKNSELKNKISSQEPAHLKTQAALKERISQLEAEKEKLHNPRFSDDDKSRFESEIQEKARQIHEFHEKNIGLKAEKEDKERMIQQLMDKLTESKKASSYSTPQVYSNPQKYSAPNNTPTCRICRNEMTDSTMKCHQCRIQFHTNCASQWLRLHKVCPSCHGRFLAPSKNRTFSTFN